ncbi:Mannose-6-phosphate isomerase [Golovinomyces cichoracearum]|uniref:Mannose-6-phosphate isomerase n=1 Tax=Golovinomyces cichoracearum TaxID=62708 RepID=A0A420J1V8_9PEZI|nr:Mannose-6-phosphate isomerase [Golovinomyces cichoracearum]
MQASLIRLQCGVNSYDWGKIGHESFAAKFAEATSADDFTVKENRPYAELWMGTHPSNPSKDIQTSQSLSDIIKDNHSLMSTEILNKFGSELPFLFKVLSIGKALSIQAHPNKNLAEQLHQKDPKNYPDDNHKPEMTIALTPFEGLCGFRPLSEISHFLSTVPTLKKLIGDAQVQEFLSEVQKNGSSEKPEAIRANRTSLKKIFRTLMNATTDDVYSRCEELTKVALESKADFAGGGVPSNTGQDMADLVIRLNKQYPGDIGLFVAFFLNYVKLDAGEAMFLKADDIHAYLSGDIIECMAASDNVVRAGLTPKFKDVDTLVEMLTYSYAPIEEQKMKPVHYPYVTLNTAAYSSDSSVLLYDPPIEEFSVLQTNLRKKGSKATFERICGPSIILCTSGSGLISTGPKFEQLKKGYVYFIGASSCVVLESHGQDFITFRAFCELQDNLNISDRGMEKDTSMARI